MPFGNPSSPKIILADDPDEIVVQGIGLEYGSAVEKKAPAIQLPGTAPSAQVPAGAGPVHPGTEWKLVSMEGRETPIRGQGIRIGRGEGNDIQLQDLKASRFHAEIRMTDEVLQVIDLDSSNGTFVNGERLAPHQPRLLSAGDEIIFGRTKFVCRR